MKKCLVLLAFLALSISAMSQSLYRIVFTRMGDLEAIEVSLPGDVILKLSAEGHILQWGYNRYAGRDDIMRDQLDPFAGRVEYYSDQFNEAFRGKIRTIGSVNLTYFASFDQDGLPGKIQSIGPLRFKYYLNQDNATMSGKIKSIGNYTFDWYNNFDRAIFTGKLKSVGNTAIAFYSETDDLHARGKIKSIGPVEYKYYGSFDQKELRGILKSGMNLRTINGIKYFIRN